MSEFDRLKAQKEQFEQREVCRIINVLRQAFVKIANGAEAMKFEDAVHAVYPFATDWIPPSQEPPTQG